MRPKMAAMVMVEQCVQGSGDWCYCPGRVMEQGVKLSGVVLACTGQWRLVRLVILGFGQLGQIFFGLGYR